MNYSQDTDQLIAKKSFSTFGVLFLSRHAFFVLSSELKFEIIAIAEHDSTIKSLIHLQFSKNLHKTLVIQYSLISPECPAATCLSLHP